MTATNDFEFIDRLVCAAEEKKKSGGIESLSVAEKHATAIWAASGIIGNGGFQYFFENGLSTEESAEAYASIGMPKIADIFRTAASLFPSGRPQADWQEALAFLRSREPLFDKLAAEVNRADAEMIARLAKYLYSARAS